MGTYSDCYRKKDGAYAATSESSSFPNLGYEIDRYLGPGEIVRLRADGVEQMRKPDEGMQILFLPMGILRFPHFLLRR